MDKLGNKDFKGWIKVKENLHNNKSLRSFSEGEVWWCGVGENVGSEICGKGKDFLRPVLVIHKLTKNGFIGVPLTSKEHHGTWYTEFVFRDKIQYAVVAQVENISVRRLHHKMGEVPESDLGKVIECLCQLLHSREQISSGFHQSGRVSPKVHQLHNFIVHLFHTLVKRFLGKF